MLTYCHVNHFVPDALRMSFQFFVKVCLKFNILPKLLCISVDYSSNAKLLVYLKAEEISLLIDETRSPGQNCMAEEPEEMGIETLIDESRESDSFHKIFLTKRLPLWILKTSCIILLMKQQRTFQK